MPDVLLPQGRPGAADSKPGRERACYSASLLLLVGWEHKSIGESLASEVLFFRGACKVARVGKCVAKFNLVAPKRAAFGFKRFYVQPLRPNKG